jgi:hypothetical protein
MGTSVRGPASTKSAGEQDLPLFHKGAPKKAAAGMAKHSPMAVNRPFAKTPKSSLRPWFGCDIYAFISLDGTMHVFQ